MNKVRLLKLSEKQYRGEVLIDNVVRVKTIGFASSDNCIRMLNYKIKEYNILKDLNIPLLGKEGEEIIFDLSDNGKVTLIKQKVEKVKEEKPAKQEASAPQEPVKPKQPKRKPFTPYGLNGYLVDKSGNVRLMLDRRANAHTIVLEPEMFSALAEMVKKTQMQNQ